jgi:hypothetical protein
VDWEKITSADARTVADDKDKFAVREKGVQWTFFRKIEGNVNS